MTTPVGVERGMREKLKEYFFPSVPKSKIGNADSHLEGNSCIELFPAILTAVVIDFATLAGNLRCPDPFSVYMIEQPHASDPSHEKFIKQSFTLALPIHNSTQAS